MTEEVSATEPDWSREDKPFFAWHPAKSLVMCIRDYQRAANRRGPYAWLCRRSAKLRHIFWAAITGAEIPIACQIGGGFLVPHPNGIVIHPDAIIGPNCLLFQQVTLAGGPGGAPVISGHVDIGAGARVIGGVKVGQHVKIGANAVVLTDLPDRCTAVGIPAKIIAQQSA